MTTSTEIATIDGEIVEPEVKPLNKTEAKALDKKIRTTSDRVTAGIGKVQNDFDQLVGLIDQAAQGEIHKALGLKSWAVWLKDAVQFAPANRIERKELIGIMSGKGLSQRTIAGMLNVSQKTVDRDLDGEVIAEGATVTSLDGAKRPKNKAKDVAPEQEPLEAETEELEEDEKPEAMTAVAVVAAFDDEVANLWAAHTELDLLLSEEKWPNARKRVAAANLNHLQQIITTLQNIVDNLMEA
jgi:transposase